MDVFVVCVLYSKGQKKKARTDSTDNVQRESGQMRRSADHHLMELWV